MENNQFSEDRLLFVDQIESLIRQGNLPEALAMAEERLAGIAGDVDAQALIHRVLLEMGRMEDARNILRHLEQEMARLSFVYLQAADTYREKGLKQDAISYYQKFLSLNPLAEESPDAAAKLASLEENAPFSAGTAESDGTDDHKLEVYTVTLADLYIKQGHLQMAADILTEIIRRDPLNIEAGAKLDTVKAAIVLKSASAMSNSPANNNLLETLACWLANIDRLRKHAL
jgi:tetratricopeptide (TPR) repeat protein